MSQKIALRVYGRAELARIYYGRPVTDNAALKWLMREIKNFPGLYENLCRYGFKKSGKLFSCTQVAVIFNALGWPES